MSATLAKKSSLIQDAGNSIMNGTTQLNPMQSTHNNSAIMQARPKAVVDKFSDKAFVDYKPYQSVDGMGTTNPVLWRQNADGQQTGRSNDQPKRLMPAFPRKQGQNFRVELGQNVSFPSINLALFRRGPTRVASKTDSQSCLTNSTRRPLLKKSSVRLAPASSNVSTHLESRSWALRLSVRRGTASTSLSSR